MSPEALWRVSRAAHQRGHARLARLIKLANFLIFHCVLPPEVQVDGEVELYHRGLGVVFHPSVSVSGTLVCSHGVTFGVAGDQDAIAGPRILVQGKVFIGAGAIVLAPEGRSITLGDGCAIGAGCVITNDVPPRARMAGPKAAMLRIYDAES